MIQRAPLSPGPKQRVQHPQMWSPQIYYNHHEDLEDLVNSQSVSHYHTPSRELMTHTRRGFPQPGGQK